MKVKDLPDDTKLDSIKVRLPKSVLAQLKRAGLSITEGYIVRTGYKVVWFSESLERRRKVFPLFVHDPTDVLNWEIVDA